MGSSRNRPAPGPPGGDRRHGPGHRRRRPRRRRPAGPDPTPHHRGGGPGNAAVRFAARWKDSRRGGGAVNRVDCQRSSRTYQFSTPVGALGSGTGLLVWILTEMKMMAGALLASPAPSSSASHWSRLPAHRTRVAVRSCRLRALAHPCPLPPERVAVGSLPVSVVVALECSHGRCRAAPVVPAFLSDRAVVVVDDCLAQRPDALDHDLGCAERAAAPACRRLVGGRHPLPALLFESAKRRRRDLEGGRRWRSRKERGNGMVLRTTRAAQARPGTTARTTGGGAVRGRYR